MGLLLVMGSSAPRRNGLAYLAGAFMIQAGLLLGASILIGGTISRNSDPGRSFVGARIAIGAGLVLFGLLLRRPPGKPVPEIPHALERLRGMGPRQSFVAGIVVADYQGPVLASLALATTGVSFGGRLVALGVYSLLATGIPLGIMIWATRSERARGRIERATAWVMRNRRGLASWLSLALGLLLFGDGIFAALTS